MDPFTPMATQLQERPPVQQAPQKNTGMTDRLRQHLRDNGESTARELAAAVGAARLRLRRTSTLLPRMANRRAAMVDLTLAEARRIVAEEDVSDPARAIEAVAVLLRFDAIVNPKLLPIAEDLESVANSIRKENGNG